MPVSFIASLIRFRIIPLTIVFSCMLLGVKVYDLAVGTNELSRMLIAGEAIAVPSEEPAETEMAEKEEQSAEEASAEKEGEEASAEATAEEKKGEQESASLKQDEDPMKHISEKKHFSQIELDILQSLSERRDELSKWEEEIRMKENLLEATEIRINKKIDEIKLLEESVREILEQYDEHEDGKIRSLVKIYENMKAKEAARIFDEMELPVLLMVVDRMWERKAAPILAKMDPKKAKQLTVELAEQRKTMDDSRKALDNN